jgi:hypothetical protein
MKLYNSVSILNLRTIIQYPDGASVVAEAEPNDATIIGFQGPDVFDCPQKSVRNRPEYQDKPRGYSS